MRVIRSYGGSGVGVPGGLFFEVDLAGPPVDGEAGGGAVAEGGHCEGEAYAAVGHRRGVDLGGDHLDRVGPVVARVEDVEVGVAHRGAKRLVGEVVGAALQTQQKIE